ncbi:hypothetical protein [Halomonas sp. hl-4]|uniref:hypothetical protein n=1 Tax=Halomonas sp. hl-4 TaxID=1761789 RepID=UPI001E3AF244|nr:hypothetical protein [Halomonas sp. hl-4]
MKSTKTSNTSGSAPTSERLEALAMVDCIEHSNTPDEAVERVHGLVSELAESVSAYCR